MESEKSQDDEASGDPRRDGNVKLSTVDGDTQKRHPRWNGVSSSETDATMEAREPKDLVQPMSVNGKIPATPPQNTSHPGVRPSLPTKAGTDIPKKGPQGSFGRLQRFATANAASLRLSEMEYTQGENADVDSSSDSSEDEMTGEPLERTMSTRQQKKEQKKRRKYSRFRLGNNYLSTTGKVRKRDGRVNISVNETDSSGYLAKALGTGFRHHFFRHRDEEETAEGERAEKQTEDKRERDALPKELDDFRNVPRLNIVIIVIGSRGDVQPFLKVGKILKQEYGHRVRLATHPSFKDFVEKDGDLEFFSVGGDPSELMAFMVKNPGLVPSIESIRAGDIGARRAQMAEMFEGMWRACINATDDEDNKENIKMMGSKEPFIADAIIANPPSFAHLHIAEALGVPLHMMFTFPYTPTTHFPHPLANIKSTNVDHAYANFMSYPLVELLTWQGLGDLINNFRVQTLGLEEVSTLWAPGQIYRLQVPFTYMWSPGLVPKPHDYGPNIDIGGFVFLDLGSSFTPPEELMEFLDAGEPPVYIGFGSIVVDDPNAFTSMIFEAVKLAGVRALVSKGWGGLGGGDIDVPENIFLLDNTPHDWLFPKVSAVIHHGGAGTTAIGLKCGKPTMIVPFFGDQPFWGAMVAKKRAGAFECIPHKRLTVEKFAEGIKQCLTDEARDNVLKIAESIALEGDGAYNAVKSFHRHLNLSGSHSIRCSILENRVAVWRIKKLGLRLSALAAYMLAEQKKLRWQDLRLVRHNEWNDFEGPGGPITGFVGPVLGTVVDAGMGMASIPLTARTSIKKRRQHHAKQKRIEKRRKKPEEMNGKASGPQTMLGAPNATTNGRAKLQRQITGTSVLSAGSSEPLIKELMKETGHALQHTGQAVGRLPLNILVGLTQGFHNAPRLYGDDTVRKPHRISGFSSGIRAGRDELLYGVWDGWTGVVTQPWHEAKKHGALGAVEGTAMGVGGFFLKNIAAFFGPLAYTAKGIEKEIHKSQQPTNFIRKARILQGAREFRALQDAAKPRPKEGLEAPNDDSDCPSEGESLESVQKAVNEGLEIIMELLDAVEEKKSQGPLEIKGRIGFFVTEKKWFGSGAPENVHTAKVALEAKRAGKNIDHALEEWRQKQQGVVVAAAGDHRGDAVTG